MSEFQVEEHITCTGQLIQWTDWLRIQNYIIAITFSFMPDISSSASQAISLEFDFCDTVE